MATLFQMLSKHFLGGIRYVWIAALPVSELRVAIPLAIHAGVNPFEALALCVIGNLLPVLPLLWVFQPVTSWLRRHAALKRPVEWMWASNLRKSRSIRAYGLVGLAVFVAIPAPGTGAWTGAIIASLLKMPFWSSAVALSMGVVIAGIIVTALSVMAL
ncbi:MAG: small multi-drug export protein [Firmicutes bacterium]|nr:small multi-drug export protein [Bacillota bacterium]